jgi:hypothetical protein
MAHTRGELAAENDKQYFSDKIRTLSRLSSWIIRPK